MKPIKLLTSLFMITMQSGIWDTITQFNMARNHSTNSYKNIRHKKGRKRVKK